MPPLSKRRCLPVGNVCRSMSCFWRMQGKKIKNNVWSQMCLDWREHSKHSFSSFDPNEEENISENEFSPWFISTVLAKNRASISTFSMHHLQFCSNSQTKRYFQPLVGGGSCVSGYFPNITRNRSLLFLAVLWFSDSSWEEIWLRLFTTFVCLPFGGPAGSTERVN